MALFYAVDQEILEVPKHQSTKLYPREMVTLALLCAIKGGGMRGVCRWRTRDSLLITTTVLLDAVSGPGSQLLNGLAFSGHADDRHLQAPAFHHGKAGKLFL
jgi:hypothetical protein